MLKRTLELPLWIAFYGTFAILLLVEKLRGTPAKAAERRS